MNRNAVIEAALVTGAIGAIIFLDIPARLAWRRWDIPTKFRFDRDLADAPAVGTRFWWRHHLWTIQNSVSFKPGYVTLVAERRDA